MTATILALALVGTAQTTWQGALGLAMQDEYRAAATYSAVIANHGKVRPFVNILRAELKHQQMLTVVFQNHSLKPPADTWAQKKDETLKDWAKRLQVPPTFKGACELGVQAEVENIALYERLLKLEMPKDVQEAFTRLQAASRDNHLPAFKRCATRG